MRLTDALAIHPGDLVAFVGGGGKTTALYLLGAELAEQGVPMLLSGSTRFTPPHGAAAPNLSLVSDAAALLAAVADENRGWPRTVAVGWGNKGRLLPLDPAWLDRLQSAYPQLTIALEADGSAMRPFKAPGEHEPVIPNGATVVVSVAGMDCIGRPLDATHVHRPELVASLTGATLGDSVSAELVAATLLHPAGGHKGVPAGARWIALLNKADTPARRAAAEAVAARLSEAAARVVITQLLRSPPVLAVSGA